MATITQTLSQKHIQCDTLFAQLEVDVANGQWPMATPEFAQFVEAMEQHFSSEEHILFPAFEQHMGQPTGPTQVMRMEHQQMRQLFQEMRESVAKRNRSQYLGLSETLLMLMRQHNAKEEQILYPMCDQALNGEIQTLLEHMEFSSTSSLHPSDKA